MKYSLITLFALFACSASNDDIPTNDSSTDDYSPPIENSLYFPPINSDTWKTITISALGWNTEAQTELIAYLTETDTEAFLLLKDGKIVIESYLNGAAFETFQPWNSAGKTLTAFTVGIAEKQRLLSLDDPTTDHLGTGWTQMTTEQENDISLFHQLTMTSGGDYNVDDTTCYDPACLLYLDEPGSFWYYHNAFYTLLQPVLDEVVSTNFRNYFDGELRNIIGMNGAWITLNYNNVYFSNARSMARFGLLNLNKGAWNGNRLIETSYFQEMTNTSQSKNKAYGYLWWLNGKNSYQLPQSTLTFSGALIPNAPADLIAGLGKNDQKLYVVPSQGLVIVRMGGTAGMGLLGPSSYDNELWEKIYAVIN